MSRRSIIALSCVFIILAMLTNKHSPLPIEHFLVRAHCAMHSRFSNSTANKPIIDLSKVHLKVRYKTSEVRFIPCLSYRFAPPQQLYVTVKHAQQYICLLNDSHATSGLRGPPSLS